MKKEYSGRTSAHSHKFSDWKSKECNGTKAIKKVTLIEAQWSDMPIEVYEEVAELWRWMGFGNDYYYFNTSINELNEMMDDGFNEDMPEFGYLFQWLDEKGFKEKEKFLLHFWW